MAKMLLFVILLQFLNVVTALRCSSKNIACLSASEYRICFQIGGAFIFAGNTTKCPSNYICNDSSFFPCVKGPPVPTTPPPPVSTPACSGAGRYQGPKCGQYYECTFQIFWWGPILRTCPRGSAYNAGKRACSTDLICPTSPVVPIRCTRFERFPGETCGQYYECVQSWWWWWEPVSKICSSGAIYDAVLKNCSAVLKCNSPTTSINTTPKLITTQKPMTKKPTTQKPVTQKPTTRRIPPRPTAVIPVRSTPNRNSTTIRPSSIPLPRCSGAGKYLAEKCNQYYECVQNFWWWEPRLKTCPTGQGFNNINKQCSVEIKCN